MNNLDHKNLELLRYYVSRDMRRIENKISADNNELVGFFVASLVDISIVALFNDWLSSLCFGYKILAILVLMSSFIVLSRVTNTIQYKLCMRRKAAGRDNDKLEEITRIIDEFDNIASDGLLLCSYYRDKYESVSNSKMKTFYLYETFHYLEKSCSVYRKIAEDYSKYVSTEDSELISTCRIKNYLEIAEELSDFLNSKVDSNSDPEFVIQVNNVSGTISLWREQQENI